MLVVDTSVLVRAFDNSSPDYQTARRFFVESLRKSASLVAFPQVIVEFRVVSTRPAARNGLGRGVRETDERIDLFERLGKVLAEHPDGYPIWRTLVAENQVKGKQNHDARIAAQALAHGIPSVVTFNTKDFERYQQLKVCTPEEALLLF